MIATHRTRTEIVLLALSALGAITLMPFTYIRLVNNQPLVAAVDAMLVLMMLAFFLFVYKTRKVEVARIVLAIFFMVVGILQIKLQEGTAIAWYYPCIIAVYYLTPADTAVKICSFFILILFAVLFPLIPVIDFLIISVTILLTNAFSFVIFRSYHQTQIQLRQYSFTDSLTQAGNRRALDRKLLKLIQSQQREEYVMCLILLDLDFFKAVNDSYGHAVGDEVLVAVSKLMVSNIRVLDSFYRYGGEEFIIVPLISDVQRAAVVAEKLRAVVENYQYSADVSVTISLGVAQYQPGETAEEWISRADSALYLAKSTGRNKVCLAV